MRDQDFEIFRAKIYKKSGLHFTNVNRVLLENRVKARLVKRQVLGYKEYYDLICQDQEELKELLESMTVNLTYFFRNEGHFKKVRDIVREKVKGGVRSLSIWSVGCSTGEEVYSLAMNVLDVLMEIEYKFYLDVKILGTDLNLKAIEVARKGIYHVKLVRNRVKRIWIEEYFDWEGDHYIVKDKLKVLCNFEQHNLKLDEVFEERMDIIFCRNVMIYFDKEMQEESVERLARSSKPGGYLFIGHSESLYGLRTRYLLEDWEGNCLYYRLNEKAIKKTITERITERIAKR